MTTCDHHRGSLHRGVFLVLLFSFGCSSSSRPAMPLDRVQSSVTQGIQVGGDDSIAVASDGSNVPEALVPLLDAVGRMQGTACTGSHLGNHLVLTAAHCIMAESMRECASTAIEWGVRGDRNPGLVGRCVRVAFAELTVDRDVAVFEVDWAPEARLRADVCRTRGPGDGVFLLAHPERRPLVWSGRCLLETPEIVLGPGRIGHVCDSSVGSSGGPLLDAETLEVVGVHVGAAGTFNQATLLTSCRELFSNEGLTCRCESP